MCKQILLIMVVFLFLGCHAVVGVSNSNDIRDNLQPPRLTIAMWDFSWLNGHYPGGWAEDFDKVTDELIERKFNTVRIDVFPMLIDTLIKEGKTKHMIKAQRKATWGVSTMLSKARSGLSPVIGSRS